MIRQTKADFLYLPKDEHLYKNVQENKFKISKFSQILCGKYRPGHFNAVVNVINKFIKILRPQKIYLGEKDMQQLIIVNDFVKRYYSKINIVGCKTIREKNGIALSSRNFLLSKKEILIASSIFKYFKNFVMNFPIFHGFFYFC